MAQNDQNSSLEAWKLTWNVPPHWTACVTRGFFFVGVSKQSYYDLGGSGGQSGLGGFEGKSKKSPKEKCSSKT